MSPHPMSTHTHAHTNTHWAHKYTIVDPEVQLKLSFTVLLHPSCTRIANCVVEGIMYDEASHYPGSALKYSVTSLRPVVSGALLKTLDHCSVGRLCKRWLIGLWPKEGRDELCSSCYLPVQ